MLTKGKINNFSGNPLIPAQNNTTDAFDRSNN